MQRMFKQKLAPKPYYLSPTELTCYAEEFSNVDNIPKEFSKVREGVYVVPVPQTLDAAEQENFKNFIKDLPHGAEILSEYEELLSAKNTPRPRRY